MTYREIKSFAYGELGLRPWEFKDMTFDEYHHTCQGYLMSKQKGQVPLRKLYQVIYNANSSKHQIRSIGTLSQHWPLPLIDEHMGVVVNMDSMRERWEETKRKKAERDRLAKKKIANGNG